MWFRYGLLLMTKVYGKTAKLDSSFNVFVCYIFLITSLSKMVFCCLDAHICNMAVIWGAI
jgi:hypothetical protein